MTDWVTIAFIIIGFVLQPILYELSPLPEIVMRIRRRKEKKPWWNRVLNSTKDRKE